MIPVAVGLAAASAVMGGVQMYQGIQQGKKNKRPIYEIPAEISQNLTQAQQQALQGLPEEQKQQYLTNLQRGSAYALGQSGDRKGGLTGIAAINQQQTDAYGNLLSLDASARMANQDKLMGARQTMADYRDQAFQYNKVNPYEEKRARSEALIGAGMQNISGGLQTASSAYSTMKAPNTGNNIGGQSGMPFNAPTNLTNPYSQGNTPPGLTNPYRKQ